MEKEAEKRGLLNLRTTDDALPCFVSEKNIRLFTKHRIFNETEMRARYEIQLESYCKMFPVEAVTMLEMARKEIMPARSAYCRALSNSGSARQSILPQSSGEPEESLAARLAGLNASLYQKTELLDEIMSPAKTIKEAKLLSEYYRDSILPAMRAAGDEIERLVADEYWPFPTYGDLLFHL